MTRIGIGGMMEELSLILSGFLIVMVFVVFWWVGEIDGKLRDIEHRHQLEDRKDDNDKPRQR